MEVDISNVYTERKQIKLHAKPDAVVKTPCEIFYT